MAHEFEIIEDEIISALEPLKASLGVRMIEPEIDQLLDLTEKEMSSLRKPAIFVSAMEMSRVVRNQRDVLATHLKIVVIDSNLRAVGRATRGDTLSSGVFELLIAIRNLLHRATLTTSVGKWELILAGEQKIAASVKKGIAVYGQDYGLKMIS